MKFREVNLFNFQLLIFWLIQMFLFSCFRLCWLGSSKGRGGACSCFYCGFYWEGKFMYILYKQSTYAAQCTVCTVHWSTCIQFWGYLNFMLIDRMSSSMPRGHLWVSISKFKKFIVILESLLTYFEMFVIYQPGKEKMLEC